MSARELRYHPVSWIDAVVDWVRRRRIGWWLVFVVLFVGWTLIFNLIRWLEGTTAFPELDPITLDVFFVALPLPAYGLLTAAAGRALDRFLPALDEPAERLVRSRRRLTSMPLWLSIVVFVLGAAIGYLSYLSEPSDWPVYGTSITMFVVGLVIGNGFGYGAVIVVYWQAIRILLEVVSLHRRAAKIEIDRPGPTHAFAPVTAGAAIFMITIIVYAAATDGSATTSWASVGLTAVVAAVAVAIFVLPLLGMRSRLIEEKRLALDAIGRRMVVTVATLDSAVDERRYVDVGPLQTAVAALVDRADRVKRASTWPWEARVASGFATALFFPIATWLITTYAGKLLGL